MSLFIGGPADGEHRAVYGDSPVTRIREMPPLRVDPSALTMATLNCIDHDYRRIKMVHGIHVYLHESLHPDEILPMLLSGYRNPKPLKRP